MNEGMKRRDFLKYSIATGVLIAAGEKWKGGVLAQDVPVVAEVDKLTRLLNQNGRDVRNSSIRAKPANQERLRKGLVKDETIRRLLRMDDGDPATRRAPMPPPPRGKRPR